MVGEVTDVGSRVPREKQEDPPSSEPEEPDECEAQYITWDSAPECVQTRTREPQSLNEGVPCRCTASFRITLLEPEATALAPQLREPGGASVCYQHGSA